MCELRRADRPALLCNADNVLDAGRGFSSKGGDLIEESDLIEGGRSFLKRSGELHSLLLLLVDVE